MTDDLIEALEEVLAKKLMEELPRLYERTGRPEGKSLNSVARECLRQMQWVEARLPSDRSFDSPQRPSYLPEIGLAPPDWQP